MDRFFAANIPFTCSRNVPIHDHFKFGAARVQKTPEVFARKSQLSRLEEMCCDSLPCLVSLAGDMKHKMAWGVWEKTLRFARYIVVRIYWYVQVRPGRDPVIAGEGISVK